MIKTQARSTVDRSMPVLSRELRKLITVSTITLFATFVLMAFFLPLGYMVSSAFMLDAQRSAQNAPLWPAKAVTYRYQDQDLALYDVPDANGVVHQWALVKGYREDSDFVDPAHPEQGVFNWKGRYRTLNPVYQFAPLLDNFPKAWDQVQFDLLFRNTFLLALISTIGTLISCISVAYGFSRFRIPGKNIIFLLLMSTIVLPLQTTIIPLYIFFTKLGWTGTWLPLLVPAFFANAFDVFLLRQYFMSIPRELDEAAMIDGATPLRVLISVIIPQAIPAITAVTLFHFFFVWNDYFAPLVYLAGKEDLYPISVGLGKLVSTFSRVPGMAMASAIMAIALPVVIFFLAQRQFMQGIVFTGVEK
ncbi:MAG: carbohydrate ABC transporter permease [Acidobacteriota bacterium]